MDTFSRCLQIFVVVWLADDMHIEADVDVRDEVAPASRLELVAFAEPVNAAKDNIAAAKMLWSILPAASMCIDLWIPYQRADHPRGDVGLGRAPSDVLERRAHETVQIGVFDEVCVIENEALATYVRELLHDVRASAAQADDAEDRVGEPFLRDRSEERLA